MDGTDVGTDVGARTQTRVVGMGRYGGPEVLELREQALSAPGPGELLVRVRAASVNAADYRLMRADPALVRLAFGLRRPRAWLPLGCDFAGEVLEVGPDVDLAPGERVMGEAFQSGRGALAEVVRVKASSTVRVPDGVSLEAAAAVPLAGITAVQGVYLHAQVRAGQRILVQGGGGGVGGFVVQICKALGAHVTVVCGPGSVDAMRDFGADLVLDYRLDELPAQVAEGARFDAILAVNGRRSPLFYRRALTPGGRLVIIGGSNRQLYEGLFLTRLLFLGSGKRASVVSLDPTRYVEDLAILAELLAAGKLRPAVARTFSLDQVREAFAFVEQGHVRGKVIVRP